MDVLNVSLDDIVKQNRMNARKQRDGGRPKATRRAHRRLGGPYNRREESEATDDAKWKNDKFDVHEKSIQLNRSLRAEEDQGGYRVRVRDIAEGVTEEELKAYCARTKTKELFSAVGRIKRVRMMGRRGSMIHFETKNAAMNAVELYHGKSLDESAMTLKVEYLPRIVPGPKSPPKGTYGKNSVRNITVKVL